MSIRGALARDGDPVNRAKLPAFRRPERDLDRDLELDLTDLLNAHRDASREEEDDAERQRTSCQ